MYGTKAIRQEKGWDNAAAFPGPPDGLPNDQIPGFGILQQFGFIKCSRTSELNASAKLDPCLWKTTNETLNSQRGLALCQSSGPGGGCCMATGRGLLGPQKI